MRLNIPESPFVSGYVTHPHATPARLRCFIWTPASLDMPELLSPEPDEQDALRVLNRSPHPYHHQSFEIPYPSDVFVQRNAAAQTESHDDTAHPSPTAFPSFAKDSSPASESGTEADDEHFLKGLPAPKAKLHKGLRGRNEPLSGSVTPLLSPAILEGDHEPILEETRTGVPEPVSVSRQVLAALRRKRIWVRRATEVGILAGLWHMVRSNAQVAPLFDVWSRGMCPQSIPNLFLTGCRFQAPRSLVRWTAGTLPSSDSHMGLSTPSTIEMDTD